MLDFVASNIIISYAVPRATNKQIFATSRSKIHPQKLLILLMKIGKSNCNKEYKKVKIYFFFFLKKVLIGWQAKFVTIRPMKFSNFHVQIVFITKDQWFSMSILMCM